MYFLRTSLIFITINRDLSQSKHCNIVNDKSVSNKINDIDMILINTHHTLKAFLLLLQPEVVQKVSLSSSCNDVLSLYISHISHRHTMTINHLRRT